MAHPDMRDPEDFPGGVGEMIDQWKPEEYEDLKPLPKRTTSHVSIRGGGDEDMEAKLYKELGYSAPIALYTRLVSKMYGFMRDGNLETHLEQTAVRQMNALNDIIMSAPCVNRQGRYEEEERRAQHWIGVISRTRSSVLESEEENEEDEKSQKTDLEEVFEDLIHRWSAADAFMLQARIVEERQGIDAAQHLYERYKECSAKRDAVEMEATELPPAHYQLFWCRVRQYRINRERSFDLAMDYPVEDMAEVKAELDKGKDVNDLVHKMLWPYKESYQLVLSSMLDGKAHREMVMAMIAQQLPSHSGPQQQYGYPYPPMNGHQPAGADGLDESGQPDTRPALFKFFGGGGKGQQAQQEAQQQKPNIRRRRRRGER